MYLKQNNEQMWVIYEIPPKIVYSYQDIEQNIKYYVLNSWKL